MWRRVVLEVSLKPFFRDDARQHRLVAEAMFTQWRSLIDRADELAVLIWAADGSEILDYQGRLDQPLEWAHYIGGANPKDPVPGDPDRAALHSRSYDFRDNPPHLTYSDLAQVVGALKSTGRELLGKPVSVGATFDPGPEFAKSSFKYERHSEICLTHSMGHGQKPFVVCYARLKADDTPYAAFPNGIPEGLPLGAFLGGQAQKFAADCGFDYLWLSNGFGFGTETWAMTGPLFDGEKFAPARRHELARDVLSFWRHFRQSCNLPVETRGTNLSVGIDLASDATPARELYAGGFNFVVPVNSPWAALDNDFGLEIVGALSRIAVLPADAPEYSFRFYTHDPWWLNSPWLDRYGRQPHDIYLPISIGRLDADGSTQAASRLALLTVDDSFGRMPPEVPNEVTPHLLRAHEDNPDAPGPVVWLYPFDEYHYLTFGAEPRLEEVFFCDNYMRGVINAGVPVNTVVGTRYAVRLLDSQRLDAAYWSHAFPTPAAICPRPCNAG